MFFGGLKGHLINLSGLLTTHVSFNNDVKAPDLAIKQITSHHLQNHIICHDINEHLRSKPIAIYDQ